jgi:hypothetical protein
MSHGFTNGQIVYFTGVGGMTQLNDNVYTVANASANTFELSGINSTGYSAFTTGGTVARPYLTFAFAFGNVDNRVTTGDTLRVAKTTAATTHSLGNVTFTQRSTTVSTTVSYVGVINIGDLIGTPTAAGNGADETFYRVTGVSASQITLMSYYAGPATVTVGGIKVQPAQASGPNPGATCNITVGCTVSGGWTLSSSPTQDGETWLKSTGTYTSSSNFGITGTAIGITVEKMNNAQSYYCLYNTGAGSVYSNCSFIDGYVYTVYSLGTGTVLSNVRICGNGGPSWGTYYPASTVTTNNVIISGYGTATAQTIIHANNTTMNFTNGCVIRCSGYALNGAVTGAKVIGGTIDNCNYGIIAGGSQQATLIENVTFTNCTTYGIYSSSQSNSMVVRNCTFNLCGRSMYLGQMHGALIEGCTFSNSTNYDIDIDVYSGNIYSVGNHHVTPGIRAYNRGSSSGPIYIIKCDIDAV